MVSAGLSATQIGLLTEMYWGLGMRRTLLKADIEYYQKVVVALSEKIRIMKQIDEVIERHSGWPGAFRSETKTDGKVHIEERYFKEQW